MCGPGDWRCAMRACCWIGLVVGTALVAGTLGTASAQSRDPSGLRAGSGADADQATDIDGSAEHKIDALFAKLKATESASVARGIELQIRRLWWKSGSDTVDLIMLRARQAIEEQDFPLALDNLDLVISMNERYAEAWNQRALVHYLAQNYQQSAGDLERVLALEPRHFDALGGLINVMRSLGRDDEAYDLAKRLRTISPQSKVAKETLEALHKRGHGQAL